MAHHEEEGHEMTAISGRFVNRLRAMPRRFPTSMSGLAVGNNGVASTPRRRCWLCWNVAFWQGFNVRLSHRTTTGEQKDLFWWKSGVIYWPTFLIPLPTTCSQERPLEHEGSYYKRGFRSGSRCGVVVVRRQRLRVVIPQGAFSQSAPLILQFVVQLTQALSGISSAEV